MALLRDFLQCGECHGITWESIQVGNMPLDMDGAPLLALENPRVVFRCTQCGHIFDYEEENN